MKRGKKGIRKGKGRPRDWQLGGKSKRREGGKRGKVKEEPVGEPGLYVMESEGTELKKKGKD